MPSTLSRVTLALLLALEGCKSVTTAPPAALVDVSSFAPVTLSDDDDLRTTDAVLVAALTRLGPLEGEDLARPTREAVVLGQSPDGLLRVEVTTKNLVDDSLFATQHRWHGQVDDNGMFTIADEESVQYRCRRGDKQREAFGPELCP